MHIPVRLRFQHVNALLLIDRGQLMITLSNQFSINKVCSKDGRKWIFNDNIFYLQLCGFCVLKAMVYTTFSAN